MRSFSTSQINVVPTAGRAVVFLFSSFLFLLLSGCETSDTATGVNADGTPDGTTDSVVTQFTFDTPSEQSLVYSGVPGPEQSTVTVTATGANNLPVPGAPINFTIASGAGVGATLIGQDINGIVARTTSSEGTAVVTVQSGTAPGILQVQAVNPSTGVTELSPNIEISTGAPVQNRLNLGSETPNPADACCIDGVEVNVVIRATDQLGAAVPDGTVFQFLASESGLLQDSFCTTTNGSCTVVWETSGPRPTDGLVNIIAYTNGAEQFDDLDGDGVYTNGVDFFDGANDTPEPFQDFNNNGSYDLGVDLFVDINPVNGAWDDVDNDTWDGNTVIWTSTNIQIYAGPPQIFDCDASTVALETPTPPSIICGSITTAGITSLQATVSDSALNGLEEGATIEWELETLSGGAGWDLDGINELSYTVIAGETNPINSTEVDFNPGADTGTGEIRLIVTPPSSSAVTVAIWTISI